MVTLTPLDQHIKVVLASESSKQIDSFYLVSRRTLFCSTFTWSSNRSLCTFICLKYCVLRLRLRLKTPVSNGFRIFMNLQVDSFLQSANNTLISIFQAGKLQPSYLVNSDQFIGKSYRSKLAPLSLNRRKLESLFKQLDSVRL